MKWQTKYEQAFEKFLTNTNSCSILNLVSKKKKKPILSNGIGVPTKIDFFAYIQTRFPEWDRI